MADEQTGEGQDTARRGRKTAPADTAPPTTSAAETTREARTGGAPYPGAGFFHAGRHDPLIRAMGRRLMEEDCGRYIGSPRPEWTLEHARSYAAWQKKHGVEPTGTPDETSWDALRVPRT